MALIWVNQIKGGEIHEETIGGIDIKRGYGSGYAVRMRGIWFWFRRTEGCGKGGEGGLRFGFMRSEGCGRGSRNGSGGGLNRGCRQRRDGGAGKGVHGRWGAHTDWRALSHDGSAG